MIRPGPLLALVLVLGLSSDQSPPAPGTTDIKAIARDAAGNLYVLVETADPNFQTTAGAFDRTCDQVDAGVQKFSPSGDLVYATCLGGGATDSPAAIAVDSSGRTYITGTTTSTDFPLKNAAQSTAASGFLAVLNESGTGLVYATYVGGNVRAIAVDAGGSAVIGGRASTQLTVVNAAQDTCNPWLPITSPVLCDDGFVAKYTSAGALVFSTFFGGVSSAAYKERFVLEEVRAIALDRDGVMYAAGVTDSPYLPTTAGVWDRGCGTDGLCNRHSTGSAIEPVAVFSDAFVAKLDPNGQLLASTYFGGSSTDLVNEMAVDPNGGVYISARTDSPDFPTTFRFGPGAEVFGAVLRFDASLAKVSSAILNLIPDAGFDVSSNPYTPQGGPRNVSVDGAGRVYVYYRGDTFVGAGGEVVVLDSTLSSVVASHDSRLADGAMTVAGDATMWVMSPTGGRSKPVPIRPGTTLVVRVPSAGSDSFVEVSPSNATCSHQQHCTIAGASGTMVLTPRPANGFAFVGWRGDPDCLDGIVTVAADRACRAYFGSASTFAPRPDIVEMNGDNMGDVFAYSATTGEIRIGYGPRIAPTIGAVTGKWSAGWQVSPADFNADGLTDLLLYDRVTGQWYKAMGNGRGSFDYFTSFWSPGWDVAILDLNHDGRSDVFLYNGDTGYWFRCLSTGSSDFVYQPRGVWQTGWTVRAASFDADAFDDLFLYNPSSGQWAWAVNDRDRDFTYRADVWSPGWDVNVGDFNADGRSDIFLYDVVSGQWYVATNTNAGFTYRSESWSPGWTVHLVDFRHDNVTDVFLYNRSTGRWFQAFYTGSGFRYFSGSWDPGRDIFVYSTFWDDAIGCYDPVTGILTFELASSEGPLRPYGTQTGSPRITTWIAKRQVFR